MGKMSRDKGARVERLLVAELRRLGWSDVVRVPLSGAVKSRSEYEDDVAARPPGWGSELRFECKARAVGFDKIYELLPPSVSYVSFSTSEGPCAIVSLSPEPMLDAASKQGMPDIALFDPKVQKTLRSIVKKCQEWAGKAQVLALKQDRKPFIYIRWYP